MKKISLILAMIIGMSTLASCGDTESSGSKKKSSSSAPGYAQNDDDNDDKKPTEENTEDDTEEATEDDTEEATEEKKPSATSFERGKLDGNTYSSTYNNLKVELSKDWKFLSEEEMLKTMNIGLEASGGSNINEELVKQVAIYDLMATHKTTGESIMIMYENLERTVADPESFTIEEYIENAKKSLAVTMPKADIDWNDKSETVNIGGIELEKFTININLSDYNLSLVQEYCVKKMDKFIFVINYSSGTSDNTIDDYLDCFSALS